MCLWAPTARANPRCLVIAGLVEANTGRILYSDRQRDFQAVRRDITLVMQRSYLFNTSVYNNIISGLKYRGMNKSILRSGH